MVDHPKISVIIPAHNPGASLLDQLVRLSEEHVHEPWEVVVVDNQSSDGWPESSVEIMRYRLPVRLVSADERSGASYARNVGAAAAHGDGFLFCDADDMIRPGWVRALSQALKEADVATGPTLFTGVLNRPDVLAWHGGAVDTIPDGPTVPFGYLKAGGSGNMAVTGQAFRTIRGFDETFMRGAEDLDLCLRAQEAGFRFAYTADAVVDVRMRDSFRAMLAQHYSYGIGAAQLYSRHYGEMSRKQSVRQELGELKHLLTRSGDLVVRGDRERLVRDWSNKLGRLRGGLRARRLIPIP
ncbi:glycosyltransferase family 2 protein [Tessaracoccus sp. Y1736]